jgi:hypothetical protein
LIFVATLTHPPELCLANPSYKQEGKKWVENMRESSKKFGVTIHGAYVSPNEHTFYFVLESDNFKAVSDFFSPPMLTHHTARVSPVVTVEEGFGLSFMK